LYEEEEEEDEDEDEDKDEDEEEGMGGGLRIIMFARESVHAAKRDAYHMVWAKPYVGILYADSVETETASFVVFPISGNGVQISPLPSFFKSKKGIESLKGIWVSVGIPSTPLTFYTPCARDRLSTNHYLIPKFELVNKIPNLVQ
jgi:hypothetical protein